MSVCSKIIGASVLALVLSACSSTPSDIPVSSRTRPKTVTWGAHTVKSGETLYEIAYSYGQDFHRLAAVNGLRAPYTIYPGQKLKLGGKSKYSSILVKPSTPKKVAASSQRPSTGVKSAPYKKRPVAKKSSQAAVARKVSWQWPASGKVISRFSSSERTYKGVAIGGRIGEPVVATSAGEVVYSGGGLTGYGNLLIIKHNASYLSAYAHNKVLLVREGDRVKAGQKIAELGSTGTNEPKLYFEIRRNGKPVDPLLFLPKR
nr:peptidoglycan DD-metalloendopeptidase family protein [Sansalvadorimonas sp. 2012CJ34-2]